MSAGLRRPEHKVTLVSKKGTADGIPITALEFEDTEQASDPAFWKPLGLDAAVVITWHRMAGLLRAVRAAGAIPIAIPDSDGQIDVCTHFWPCFYRLVAYQPTIRRKLGCLKASLFRYIWQARTEADGKLASTRASEVVLFASSVSAAAFQRFLQRWGEDALAEKLRVLPLYPVADPFLRHPVPAATKAG